MICFALLAHANEEVLANQIENVKRYHPTCKIVLYNGGTDPEFGKQSGVDICPYSRPLRKGKLGHFLLGVMKWLEETGEEYDYLVNLDSDILFIRPGYEQALDRLMSGYDCMGINMGVQHSAEEVKHWYPGQTMWREWERWQPFFQTDFFAGSLNAMQVYRRATVHRMLQEVDLTRLEELIEQTEVFALEEMLYPTLAIRSGAKHRSYPHTYGSFVRLGVDLEVSDLQNALLQPNVFFVHPIERSMDNPARQWITYHGASTASSSTTREIHKASINEKPKTLTISWGCFQGGVETTLLNRLKTMNAHGYESHAYFYYGGTGLNGYTHIPYFISNQREDLVRYLREHSFDVITFINTLYNLDVLNEVGFSGKVLFEFHGEGQSIFEELQRIDRQELDFDISGIVVPGRNVENLAHQHLVTRKDLPVYIAYNTLNTNRFSKRDYNEFCELYDIPDDWENKPVVGWVGRLDPNKNWRLLLRVFRKLRQKYNLDAKLLIASDVPNSPELNPFFKKVATYGLLDDVLVLPNVPYERMPAFYSLIASSGGTLLSTSHREGYPYNLLEAQACFCPIVCTDIDGTREIVTHLETGLSYALDGTSSTAARYLYQTIADLPLRNTLITNARALVLKKNDMEANTQSYIRWLDDIIQD